MAGLIGIRSVWFPRGTLSNMARTIMILFLRWPRLPLFACLFLWLLCVHDPFFNWILRMSSFMVISLRRFIWSNRLVLLLKGSLVWYANYVVSYMVCNNLLELGLVDLTQWFRSLT